MASITDYPDKPGVLDAPGTAATPRKRRFRLLAALAAPFRDVDERAMHQKNPSGAARNNSKGNLFAPSTAAPFEVPVRPFQRDSV